MAPTAEPGAAAGQAPSRRGLSGDQQVILVCLAAVCALAWLYLTLDAGAMPAAGGGAPAAGGMAAMGMGGMDMPGMEMRAPAPRPAAAFGLLAVMWVVMMTGMMLPSAAPMVLLYAAVQRRRIGPPLLATGIFVAGYLLVWTLFGLAAAGLQQALNTLAVMTPQMALASRKLAGGVLIAAGIYELSPLKQACLRGCRGPLTFISAHWRPGLLGGLRMGAEHGLYCLGCCWALMLLLFVGGVMNILWIAGLAALVLVQKLLPHGAWSARLTGAVAVIAGVVLLAT
jgi:predicted metal-binding membrane protein